MPQCVVTRARAHDFVPRNSPRVKRRALSPVADKENTDPIHDECIDSYPSPSKAPERHAKAIKTPSLRPNTNSSLVEKKPLQEVPDTPSRRSTKRQHAQYLEGQDPMIMPTMIAADNNKDEAFPIQLPTPKTPRHRDALPKKILITPRRNNVSKKGLTPRTPRTHQTSSPYKDIDSIYKQARKQFIVASKPGKLVCRDREKNELNRMLREGLVDKKGTCLYISGPPGTGKSALVREVCEGLPEEEVTTLYLNCMSVSKPEDILAKLGGDYSGDDVFENATHEVLLSKFRSRFVSRTKTRTTNHLVVLDEVDHLLNMDLGVIYTLFEWASRKDTTFSLIAIANALDLTHRFLPRLKARNLTPHLLPLLPYTSSQIETIITSRLQSLLSDDTDAAAGFVPIMNPSAIQLCSRKVASQGGDLRKAFNIVRHAIDAVEAESMAEDRSQGTARLDFSPSKTPLSENQNLASPSRRRPATCNSTTRWPVETATRATIAQISRISAKVLGHGTAQRLASTTVQQKAILAATIPDQKVAYGGARNSTDRSSVRHLSRTCKQIYQNYCELCECEKSLQSLTFSEFADVLSSLEALGLVIGENDISSSLRGTPSKKGRGGDRRISCLVDRGELLQSLDGAQGNVLKAMIHS